MPRQRWRSIVCLGLALAAPSASALAQRTSDLRAEAVRLYESGQYREAIPYLDAVISRRPRDIEAHIKRGNVYLRLDQPATAVLDFDRIIQFAPFFPSTYTDRGLAEIMLGRLDAAQVDFNRAIGLYQRPIGNIDWLGSGDINSSWSMGGFAPVGTLDRTGKGRAVAHCGLGQVYYRLGQYAEAIAEYDRSIALNPSDPNPHTGRGDALAALDQLDPALAEFVAALQIDARHSRAGAAWATFSCVRATSPAASPSSTRP